MYPFQQSLMSSWLQAQSHRLAREPTGCLQNKSHQHNPHTLARKQARFLGPLVTTPTRTFQQPLPPLLVPHCRSKQEQCLSENACRRQQKPMRSRVFSVPLLMFKHLRYRTALSSPQRTGHMPVPHQPGFSLFSCLKLLNQLLTGKVEYFILTYYNSLLEGYTPTHACIQGRETTVENCFNIPNIFHARNFCRIFAF